LFQIFGMFGARDVCRIYVVPSAGGEPRRLQSDFAAATDPVWAPDGKHLLFLGNRDEKLSREGEESVDWWVMPLDSGPAVKTGALAATRTANLSGWLQAYRWLLEVPAWPRDSNTLIFSARSGDSTNLWQLGISPTTWTVTGSIHRLTTGATLEEALSATATMDGIMHVAFASSTLNTDIWSLPIDANRAAVMGEATRLTRETTADFHPDLSSDGTRMVWVSARSGHQEIWIRDLRTQEDAALTASRTDKYEPRFSPDGSRVSFSSYEGTKWTIYVVPSAGGAPEKVCEDCGEANAWSPDGRLLVGNRLEGQSWAVDVTARRKRELVVTREWSAPFSVSPDNRWLAFSAAGRTNVAALTGEAPIVESTWIPVMSGGKAQWSPDGNVLFMNSTRDGFDCLWAQRLDAATKQPIGTPIAIFHAHSARLPIPNGYDYFSVGRDRLLFNLDEHTADIWLAEWNDHSR
jgi:Tol biopolymer transport system component